MANRAGEAGLVGRDAEGRRIGDLLTQAPDGGGDGLREVVESYGGARRAGIVIAPAGADPAGLRALGAALGGLAVAAGHADRPGSVILPLPLRGNTRGALEMGVLPDALPGLHPLEDASARRRLAAAWGQEPAAARGYDVGDMLGAVAGLVIVADDPPVALPSAEHARRALAGLECLVVLDAFMTPAVEAAHVALPIASPAENEGTFTNAEGRIQWLRPGAPPPGAARPGWRALAALGADLRGIVGRRGADLRVRAALAVRLPPRRTLSLRE